MDQLESLSGNWSRFWAFGSRFCVLVVDFGHLWTFGSQVFGPHGVDCGSFRLIWPLEVYFLPVEDTFWLSILGTWDTILCSAPVVEFRRLVSNMRICELIFGHLPFRVNFGAFKVQFLPVGYKFWLW